MTDVTPATPAGSPTNGSQHNVTVNVGAHPTLSALPPKSIGVAYILLIFLGFLGIHQFYLGKIGRGILYLLTAGLFFVGVIVDLFTLPSQVKTINARRAVGIS